MVNIISGVKFFVDDLGINYSDIPAAFSFRSNPITNTNIVYRDPWATGSSSGILNTVGGNGFFNYYGTGNFNGTNYFELSENFSFNDSTILISYEKLRKQNEILLSSVVGNSQNSYSGFNIGINDANKLYIKYWNNVEGPFTFTYPEILSDKNILMINKTSSAITLGHFNNNTFEFSLQEFLIYENNFINNDKLYIGGNPNNPSWDLNNPSNFSGYIDRLYIFNNIPLDFTNQLVRGFFSEPTGSDGDIEEYCYTTGYLSGSGYAYITVTGVVPSGFQTGIIDITGYEQISSGYIYTGITGYSGKYLGSYIDNCGISLDIVEQVPLSGEIYKEVILTKSLTGIKYVEAFIDIELTGLKTGIENIFVNQEVCESYLIGNGDLLYSYDNNYLESLSYKEISLLTEIGPANTEPVDNDVVEIYTENYQPKILDYNKDVDYDSLNSNYFYIDRKYKSNEILMFANGQLLFDSGYELIQNEYEIITRPNFDYFVTGYTIETDRFFTEQDSLFYDIFSGNFNGFTLSNYESGTILPVIGYENSFVYRNGKKLSIGIDYAIFNSTNIQTLSGSTEYTDNFGRQFYINNDGTIIFISANNYRNNLNQVIGKIYIYKNNGLQYNLIQEITGNNINDFFGTNLSTSSDGRILAVSNNSQNNGRVWIYESNDLLNWTLKQTLSGNIGAQRFGQRLALSPDGTVLTIGSLTDVVSPNSTGSMWIYTGEFNNTWIETQKITGLMNPVGFEDIGWPANQVLNSGGSFLCIGFDSKQVGGDKFAGVVNIYTGINGIYSFSQEIFGDPVGQSSGDLFGRSLAISNNGNVLSVGSLHDQNFEQGTLDGALFIFETGVDKKFSLKQKIPGDFDSRDRINDRFGYFSDMTDDASIIVTSSQHDSYDWENPNVPGGEQNDGAVWLIGKNGSQWYLIKKIKYPLPDRFFGRSCKISRDGKILATSRSQNGNDGGGPSAIDIFEQTIGLSFNFNIDDNPDLILIKSSDIYLNNILGEKGTLEVKQPFNHGCSQVYYNGIKQKINNNYLENSNFDLISGTFKELSLKKNIYNNTEDFFV